MHSLPKAVSEILVKGEINFQRRNYATRILRTRKPVTYKVYMVRHGESEWNQKNLFCGWYDAKLSDKGIREAHAAGKALKNEGISFDIAFTSVLQRAQSTLQIILQELGQENIPVVKSWRLNERHYGALTGLNKAETADKYGEKQVQIWRRSYDTPPPPMTKDHPLYDTIVNDGRYAGDPPADIFPHFESLKLTIERTLPFWNGFIVPEILAWKRVLVAAHGNSLRGIVKHVENMTSAKIMKINLPTGVPFEYIVDDNMCAQKQMRFLGDRDTVAAAIEAVAQQGKAKKSDGEK